MFVSGKYRDIPSSKTSSSSNVKYVKEEILELTSITQSKNKLINNPKIKQKSFRASGSSESYRLFVSPKNLRIALDMHTFYVFAVGFYNSNPLIYRNKFLMNGLEIEPVFRETRHMSRNSQLIKNTYNENPRNKFSIFDWEIQLISDDAKFGKGR